VGSPTVSPALETWVFVCSLLFLAGIVLVVSTAVPSARERYPKALINGFLLAIASFALVILGAVILG
jgi:hypothetical protein